MYRFLCQHVFVSLGYIFQSEIAGLGSRCLTLWETYQTVLEWLYFFVFPPTIYESSSCLVSLLVVDIVSFCLLAILIRMQGYLLNFWSICLLLIFLALLHWLGFLEQCDIVVVSVDILDLFLILGEEQFSLLPLNLMLALGFLWMLFIKLGSFYF